FDDEPLLLRTKPPPERPANERQPPFASMSELVQPLPGPLLGTTLEKPPFASSSGPVASSNLLNAASTYTCFAPASVDFAGSSTGMPVIVASVVASPFVSNQSRTPPESFFCVAHASEPCSWTSFWTIAPFSSSTTV